MSGLVRALWSSKYVQAVLLLAVVGLLGVRSVRGVISDAGMNWDFANYYNVGARMLCGESENIYRYDSPVCGQAPVLNNRAEYVGFPLSAYLFTPLGAFSPRTSIAIFKAFCALCYAAGFTLLYLHFARRAASGKRFDLHPIIYLFLILFFEPVWRIFPIGGQATAIAFLLLVLFLQAYTAKRYWLAAIFLSVAGLIKPFLGTVALAFLLARNWQFLAALVAATGVEALLSWFLFGWKSHVEWFKIVLQESSRWAIPWWYHTSIIGILNDVWNYLAHPESIWAPMPASLRVAQTICRIALIVVLVYAVRKQRLSDWPEDEKQHYLVCWGIVFALSFPGIVWVHYWAFLLIPLTYLFAQFYALPRSVQALALLGAVFTLRARRTFAEGLDQHFFKMDNFFEVLGVSLYASAALIFVLVALLRWPLGASSFQGELPDREAKPI
jgi:hypothetical protein